MNKKRIRLTETDLHRIVKESVNKMLIESSKQMIIDDYDRVTDAFRQLIHVLIWENGNVGGDEQLLNNAENRYLQEFGETELKRIFNSVQDFTWKFIEQNDTTQGGGM